MNNTYRPCILIPCYNHGRELHQYLPHITACGIPVYVIDDGSKPEEAAFIRDICAQEQAKLITLSANKGKWHAVTDGLRTALADGFTHVLQCDADGQHAAQSIAHFLRISEQKPGHMIAGQPVYGSDVPPARLYGRKITNFFVWLETAGACKLDAMCGFRVYPVKRVISIINRFGIAPGMPGDIDILVRCCWDGLPITAEGVAVCYPEGGRSNFRMLRDNLLISWMHTKLCTAAILHPWRLVKAHRPR